MTNIPKRIWNLWQTLDDMARDLEENVNILRRQRDAGHMPDARHDKRILAAARKAGLKLTYANLADLRAPKPLDRRAVIGDLIKAAGGYRATSERTGVAQVSLRSHKSRGWLPRSARLEIRMLADEVGVVLPDEIFTRPKG